MLVVERSGDITVLNDLLPVLRLKKRSDDLLKLQRLDFGPNRFSLYDPCSPQSYVEALYQAQISTSFVFRVVQQRLSFFKWTSWGGPSFALVTVSSV